MSESSWGFKSPLRHQLNIKQAEVVQWLERLLAKEEVASSNLVFRSSGDVAKWLRRGSAKPLFTGSNPVVASNRPTQERFGLFPTDLPPFWKKRPTRMAKAGRVS